MPGILPSRHSPVVPVQRKKFIVNIAKLFNKCNCSESKSIVFVTLNFLIFLLNCIFFGGVGMEKSREQ